MSSSFTAALFLALLSSDDFCTKQLDRVAALHREFGLPLPPREAKLVEFNGHDKTVLAFAVDGVTLWPNYRCRATSIKPVKPDLDLLREADSDDWLVLALVAHGRGWEPLARAAMRKWVAWLLQFHTWDVEEDLGYTALDYWERQIWASPDISLSVIAKHLQRVQKYGFEFEKAKRHALLRSVELALKPHNSPPGSVDALIDELLDLRGEIQDGNDGPEYRRDPRYRAIVRRGLDAVPALIAHLDDDRITRAGGVMCGDNHRRVREIALDILTQFQGKYYESEKDRNKLLEVLRIWLADANKLGEEKYILSHILADGPDNSTLFWLLTDKYPHQLPDVFRKVIDTRPEQHRYAEHYARAIAESPLPAAEKRKILEYAARQDDSSVSSAGIRYLRQYKPKLAKERLLQRLVELPTASASAQRHFTSVVAESTDPDEWRAFALALRRSCAGTRIRLLDVIASATAREGRKQRLSILGEYLTDDTQLGGENVDERVRPPEVRDIVALELAELFQIDTKPARRWSAAQWAELRAKVQAKVKEELRR